MKPPDAAQLGELALYKRKCRIVICGNLASHRPEEVYTNTAPAEIVRSALAIARRYGWNLGILDVIAAFLQTPFAELAGAPLVYGNPAQVAYPRRTLSKWGDLEVNPCCLWSPGVTASLGPLSGPAVGKDSDHI